MQQLARIVHQKLIRYGYIIAVYKQNKIYPYYLYYMESLPGNKIAQKCILVC